jgi:hypothetical protein
MEYSKLISVAGLPGLYELVSTKSDGAIVRSLQDGSTRFASTRLKAMQASNVSLPDEKDAKAIKSFFEQVYPDLDFERVYISDMKKMVKWFGIIQSKGIEIVVSEQQGEEEA